MKQDFSQKANEVNRKLDLTFYNDPILFNGVVCGRITKVFNSGTNEEIVAQALKEASKVYAKSCALMSHGFEKFVHDWKYLTEGERRGKKYRDAINESYEKIFNPQKIDFDSEFINPKFTVPNEGIGWARYPFIALRPSFLTKTETGPVTGDASTYSAIELTKLAEFKDSYFKDRLIRALEALSSGSDPEIYVGLSTTPIPLTFAIETSRVSKASDKKTAKYLADNKAQNNPVVESQILQLGSQFSNDLRECFPMPNLLDIDDRFVDGSYKTKSIARKKFNFFPSQITDKVEKICTAYYAAIKSAEDNVIKNNQKSGQIGKNIRIKEAHKPLTFFSGLRADYSFGRLNHYTGTDYSQYQDYVIFTNYSDYIPHFVEEILINYVNKGLGKLVLAKATRQDDAPRIIGWKTEDNYQAFLKNHYAQNSSSAVMQGEAVLKLSNGEAININNYGDWALKQCGGETIKDCAATIGKLARLYECQMPAYHFIPNPENEEGACELPGITLVNIGVGPSNAKNICDHIAPLRSKCWLMLGHCAGIRRTQDIGQFVLANGYKREDHCMERVVHPTVSIPDLSEVESELVGAVKESIWKSLTTQDQFLYIEDVFLKQNEEKQDQTKLSKGALIKFRRELNCRKEIFESQGDKIWNHKRLNENNSGWNDRVKKRLRIGRVLTTDDRNWELMSFDDIINQMEETRAVAVDMESATIAACGYRYRIPYGTLLCVSDKPLYGELKLEGMAAQFYKEATKNHLNISLNAFKTLSKKPDLFRTMRKLNGVDDPTIS